MVVRFTIGDSSVVAAGAARAHRHIGVELGWCPHRVTLVAGRAGSRCGNMVHALAGGFRAIVAARTCSCTGKRAVVRLGSGPDRGRLVAALAVCRGGQVSARLAAQYVPVVATQALTADRDILMKHPRVPAGIATPVTTVAVADCNTCQRLVRNMIGGGPIRRWIGSTVAG